MQCFFRFVNRKCGSGSRSGPTCLRASDGSFANSDEDMANIFNEYFSGIYTMDNGQVPLVTSLVSDGISMSSVDFSPHVVRNVLRRLKPSNSSGIDGLSNLFLKRCFDSLALPLSHIFDLSFKCGVLPQDWLHAIVTPIHKKVQRQSLIHAIIGPSH